MSTTDRTSDRPTGTGAFGTGGEPPPGRDVARTGEGRSPAGGGAPLPERFSNPGLAPHRHRLADTDVRAAKRAERQVAALFGLSALGALITTLAIPFIPYGEESFIPRLEAVGLSTRVLGVGMFLLLFGIGAGAVHWAKTLMPDEERIEMRHAQRGTADERAEAVEILKTGAAESGLGRRPLIKYSLIGALGLLPLPALFLLRDLGPLPRDALARTAWSEGDRLVQDPTGDPIRAVDVVQGSIVHVLPEGLEEFAEEAGSTLLNEKAKAAVILMRLDPEVLRPSPDRTEWGYEGIVAYSKICTHMGCPVALYERTTHHLLCPCHQSTFDVTQECKVIFGPARRPLPQLPITVDDEGYLVAASGFQEPVGPSYWERG